MNHAKPTNLNESISGPTASLKLWKQPWGKKRLADGAPAPLTQPISGVHHIELNLSDINQLFNTMDPSPFHERDLDHDAEEFILSWAQEFPRGDLVDLIVHVEKMPDVHDPRRSVEEAVRHYFGYRARLNQLEFKRLMKQGRTSLLVGLSVLGLCLVSIGLFARHHTGVLADFLIQSFTITGSVAMWRPIEIYLYGWWPLWRRGRIFEKLSRISVDIRKTA